MAISIPNEETLRRYLAVLSEVIVDARAKAHYREPEVAVLLETIEQLPGSLCHWPEGHEDVVRALQTYEARHLGGVPKYTRILSEGPREEGQYRFNW